MQHSFQIGIRLLFPALLAFGTVACSTLPGADTDAGQMLSLYTVQTEGGAAIARLITSASSCPSILIDGSTVTMQQRTTPETVPARTGGAQADSKAAAFPVSSCEASLPRGTKSASIGAEAFPLAPAVNQRIVVIGDTGCRAKQSDHAFQACSDGAAWPFAEIAKNAAALKPDLVIHLGDLHYRESPCPADMAGCANSPWGYGWDTWEADFFTPARALLKAAPWVFVRGNHESCARAGQGWFRYLAPQPWTEARSCNDPARDGDGDADFSAPYSVALTSTTQLIVFDSAKTGAKVYKGSDRDYHTYVTQFRQVDTLVKQLPHNFFLTHHPILALAPGKDIDAPRPGNAALQSVMRTLHPDRLFPAGVDLAMNGHEHVFEVLGFSSDHPATLGLGNSGTMTEGRLPEVLPAGVEPAPGALINDFVTRQGLGFASLEQSAQGWRMTEFSVQGKPIFQCALQDGKSKCERVGEE
jgi:hypothetical protein